MKSLACTNCGSDTHETDLCTHGLLTAHTKPIPIMNKSTESSDANNSPSVISQFLGYITGYSTSPDPTEVEKYKQLCVNCFTYGHTATDCKRIKKCQ